MTAGMIYSDLKYYFVFDLKYYDGARSFLYIFLFVFLHFLLEMGQYESTGILDVRVVLMLVYIA